MSNKTYYETLGISNTATSEEIKRAYHDLCKKYHPDINPKTTEKFKEINIAYQTLIDPAKRKQYDYNLNTNSSEETYSDSSYDEFKEFVYRYSKEKDLSDEPIVNILEEFDKYKFETAVSAIWNRNIFVLLGNTIFCTSMTLGVLSNRIAKLFKKSLLSKKNYKSPWITAFFDAMAENTLGKFTWWSICMFFITFAKAIYYLAKFAYFIFKWLLIIAGAILFLSAISSHKK